MMTKSEHPGEANHAPSSSLGVAGIEESSVTGLGEDNAMEDEAKDQKARSGLAKSSTQRVRDFRNRQRDMGSKSSGVLLTQQSQIAIDVIKQVRRIPYKVKIIEASLIREAKRLCPCPERAQELVDKGLLRAETANAWQLALKAEEARDALTAAQLSDQNLNT